MLVPKEVSCSTSTDIPHYSTKSSETDPSLKTRHFVDIIQEISTSMRIHKEQGTILGGVHLELTGEVNDDGFSVVSCYRLGAVLPMLTFHVAVDRMHRRFDGAGRQGSVLQLQVALRS